MKVIGFTNKFYTLWEVTEESYPLGNGRNHVITHFCYIKNISFSREEAMKKYPGVTLDENLRGKTASFDTKKEIWDNVNTFRFGKYAYQNIEKVNDLSYTEWYWDQISNEDHKKFIENFLINNGYEVRSYVFDGCTSYYLMNPDALKAEKEANDEVNEVEKMLINGNPISFIPTKNLDEDGNYLNGLITYHFDNIKEMYYNGWFYYLPIKNGKPKKFKNKNVTITSYNYKKVNGGIDINVIDFEINK